MALSACSEPQSQAPTASSAPAAASSAKASFAAPKGSVELMKKINTGLSNIRKNGTYDKIYAKWFGNDNSMKITD